MFYAIYLCGVFCCWVILLCSIILCKPKSTPIKCLCNLNFPNVLVDVVHTMFMGDIYENVACANDNLHIIVF